MLNSVLCVDDDAVTLLLCKATLQKGGFASDVITAANGQEAIDIFSAGHCPTVGLILLDLNMPVKSGWDFLDEFVALENKPDAKVVILSSSADPHDREKARNYEPVVGFISKPLTVNSLDNLRKEGILPS